MSGIYIKGLEMPEKGFVDVRIFADDGCCVISDRKPPFYKEYKAIPVPEHGRLIDADEVKSYYRDEGMRVSKLVVMATINNAKTIIPADKA